MMHIVLTILKILGILILVVIGLVLTAVLGILFVPFKYEMSGSYDKQPAFDGSLRWLMGIFRIQASFKEKILQIQVSIFKSKLYQMEKNFNGEESKTNEELLGGEQLDEEMQQYKALDDLKDEDVWEEYLETVPDVKEKEIPAEEPVAKKEKVEIPDPDKVKEPKNSKGQKVSMKDRLHKKIFTLYKKAEEKIRSIQRMYKKIIHKKAVMERLWNLECTQKSIILGKACLRSMARHMMPKCLQVRCHFGFEDPCLTGKVLGYASMAYGLYGDHIILEPDFENKIIEGDFYLKGSLSLYIFVYWVLRAILNKHVRKLIKYIRHIKSREEKLWQ